MVQRKLKPAKQMENQNSEPKKNQYFKNGKIIKESQKNIYMQIDIDLKKKKLNKIEMRTRAKCSSSFRLK